ncbi:MAG: hypothetical protein QF473_31990, partial [Planctomycetota bacterium]|nr:hypothetical protein [Planctomycetota bacterium]
LKIKLELPPRDDAQILLVKEKPAGPRLIWHDIVTWQVAQDWREETLHLKLRGIPDSRSRLNIWLGNHGPGEITGGNLESFDAGSRIATVTVNYDQAGEARLTLKMGTWKVARGDPTASYRQAKRLLERLLDANYTTAEKAQLKRAIVAMRQSAFQEDKPKARELLAFAADCDRYVRSYELVKEQLIEALRQEIKEEALQPAEWLVIGPFDNTRGGGAAIDIKGYKLKWFRAREVEFRARISQAKDGTRVWLWDNHSRGTGPSIQCQVKGPREYVIHCFDSSEKEENVKLFSLPPGSENEFHTYKVTVENGKAIFSLDGQPQVELPELRPIIRLTLGSNRAEAPPSVLEIDWVKVQYPEGDGEVYNFDKDTVAAEGWEKWWTGKVEVVDGVVRIEPTPPGCSGYDQVYPPESEIDLQAVYPGYRGRQARWMKVKGYLLDFTKLFQSRYGMAGRVNGEGNVGDDMVAYALTYLHVPRETKAYLDLYRSGGTKVWLNDKEVFSKHEHPPQESVRTVFHYTIPVDLQKGENKLLLKLDERHFYFQRNHWKLMSRITDKDGGDLKGIRYSLPDVAGAPVFGHDFYRNIHE